MWSHLFIEWFLDRVARLAGVVMFGMVLVTGPPVFGVL